MQKVDKRTYRDEQRHSILRTITNKLDEGHKISFLTIDWNIKFKTCLKFKLIQQI